MAIMIAIYYREFGGEGQYVDVSMQQSLIMTTTQAIPFWVLDQTLLERSGHFRVGLTSGTRQRQTWPCKDGLVNFVVYGGRSAGVRNELLVNWMDEEGMATDDLKQIDFPNWDLYSITQEEWEKVEKPIGKFFKKHNKMELLKEGTKRGITICPVFSPSEVKDFVQLNQREFWLDVEHPELDTSIKYPGFPFKLSETPCKVRRRAPLIGEHNMEIYHREMGLSKGAIVTLKGANVI
jgi:crotonobetainyl-CoA:carnitine CoA-transferase CaiB-like acyl-CoA transferase